MLAIEDDYVAYCLDEAVQYFGSTVQADMESVEGSSEALRRGAALNVLRRYLGEPEQYRDILSGGRAPSPRQDPPFPKE